jgi:hypothetical protein
VQFLCPTSQLPVNKILGDLYESQRSVLFHTLNAAHNLKGPKNFLL